MVRWFFLGLALAGCHKEPLAIPAIRWETNIAVAEREAKRTHKRLLIWFDASWDMGGNELRRVTFQDPVVRTRISRDYIALYVDVTDDEDETREVEWLRDRLHVRGVPALYVVGGGRPDERMYEERGAFTEFVGAPKLLAMLDQVEKPTDRR